MHVVLSDRIVPDAPFQTNGYRFRVAECSERSEKVQIVELSGTPEEEVLAVGRILEVATSKTPVHVWGIRSAASVALIRSHFDALGWYDAPKNRYAYDCHTAPATFGCDLSTLGYWPGVPPLGSAATKAIRSGLNLEILKGLRLTDAPGTPGRKKKTPEEVVSELVFSGMFSPFRMGRMLYFDMFDRGIVHAYCEMELPQDLTG